VAAAQKRCIKQSKATAKISAAIGAKQSLQFSMELMFHAGKQAGPLFQFAASITLTDDERRQIERGPIISET
jgi:hypothetical protein